MVWSLDRASLSKADLAVIHIELCLGNIILGGQRLLDCFWVRELLKELGHWHLLLMRILCL